MQTTASAASTLSAGHPAHASLYSDILGQFALQTAWASGMPVVAMLSSRLYRIIAIYSPTSCFPCRLCGGEIPSQLLNLRNNEVHLEKTLGLIDSEMSTVYPAFVSFGHKGKSIFSVDSTKKCVGIFSANLVLIDSQGQQFCVEISFFFDRTDSYIDSAMLIICPIFFRQKKNHLLC